MRDYTKYNVWNEAIELGVRIYDFTSQYPKHEQFGLSSQLRRAVVSISSNIAEGTSRSSELEFCRFIEIAIGSAFEVNSQIILSKRLQYINEIDFSEISNLIDQLLKQLSSLRSKLKNYDR